MAPRFSIVTPVFNSPAHLLTSCLRSITSQTFGDWELCVVDDASTAHHICEVLKQAAAVDPRIRVQRRQTNGGIVAASNDAIAMAEGEFVVLVDHDDQLTPDALAEMAAVLTGDPSIDYAYSDEDKIGPDGQRFEPFLKPDWSPERLRSQNYCCHLSVIRRSLVVDVGGFRSGFDGSQDHDLILRVTEKARTIAHIPKILYHWCVTPGSVAGDATAKPYAFEAGRRAVAEHCVRVGIDAEVTMPDTPGWYRVRRRQLVQPSVSLLIPTAGAAATIWGVNRVHVLACIDSIRTRSSYSNFDIHVAVDPTTPESVVQELGARVDERLVVHHVEGPFNFSAVMNHLAAASTGEVLVLLNDDTEVISSDWLETMVGLATERTCGAVGARLLFADGRLQHGGVLLNGHALHAFSGWNGDHPGPGGLLAIQRECSAVTAAALATRRSVWEQLGGFDTDFAVAFNDVDYCLRAADLGLRTVVTPFAVLHHFESATRPGSASASEDALLEQRWGHRLRSDPFGHPRLAPYRGDWLDSDVLSPLAVPRAMLRRLRGRIRA